MVYLQSFHMPVAMEMAAHEKGWSIKSNYYYFTHTQLSRDILQRTKTTICTWHNGIMNTEFSSNIYFLPYNYVYMYMYKNIIGISDRLLSIYLYFWRLACGLKNQKFESIKYNDNNNAAVHRILVGTSRCLCGFKLVQGIQTNVSVLCGSYNRVVPLVQLGYREL